MYSLSRPCFVFGPIVTLDPLFKNFFGIHLTKKLHLLCSSSPLFRFGTEFISITELHICPCPFSKSEIECEKILWLDTK
jgi:hypothetical protein